MTAGVFVPADAMAQSGTAGLRGKVTDAQGAAIPGAAVAILNAATGFTRETITDSSGDYSFVSMPPGSASVREKWPCSISQRK